MDRHFRVGARVVVNDKAPGGYFALPGTVLEIVLGSRCGVTLDDRSGPAIYLDSACLEPLLVRPSRLAAPAKLPKA